MLRSLLFTLLLVAPLTSCGSDPGFDPEAGLAAFEEMERYFRERVEDPARREELVRLVGEYRREVLLINELLQERLADLQRLHVDPDSEREQFDALFERTAGERREHFAKLLDVVEAMKARTSDEEWHGFAQLERDAFQRSLNRELAAGEGAGAAQGARS